MRVQLMFPKGATDPNVASGRHCRDICQVWTRDFSLPVRTSRVEPKPADPAEFWGDVCWTRRGTQRQAEAPVEAPCVQKACPTTCACRCPDLCADLQVCRLEDDLVRHAYAVEDVLEQGAGGGGRRRVEATKRGCLCLWHGRGSISAFNPECPVLGSHRGVVISRVFTADNLAFWAQRRCAKRWRTFDRLLKGDARYWSDRCNDFWAQRTEAS